MPNIRRYDDCALSEAVIRSKSIAGVLRELGIRQAGGSHHHVSNRIKGLGLDTSHFTGQAHSRGIYRPRLRAEEVLVLLPADSPRRKTYLLRRALIELGTPLACSGCSTGPEWNGNALTLEIDHLNGNSRDCRPQNLRFLCPNCHSQTPTYCRQIANRATSNLPSNPR